ncbi:MAG: hypothetical protein BIFFINMI_02896 [Phycisphaerae bacterium]|nr:hypothetical protein [Phycisphaerae bacterium]
MDMTLKLRERIMESARLAGQWYLNNQNTEEHPWGGMHESADEGRFMYEYFKHTGWCRGMGVWGQALAIMGLMSLSKASGSSKMRDAAILAGEYLKSLQIINPSNAACHGGFREHTPQTQWSFPRDAATGGMGLCCLYKETGNEEYLERARAFAEWYHRYGSDEGGWPWNFFSFKTGRGGMTQEGAEIAGEETDKDKKRVKGDWQAGGGLVYWQLYKLTGEKKWLEYFRQLIDPLIELYERNADRKINLGGFHGDTEITYGNDDFAIIALICAYRQWREAGWLKTLRHHMARLWSVADEDGSYPSFAGTFVCNNNNLEYYRLCQAEKIDENLAALWERIMKTVRFGLTLQERESDDLRAYGGFYGQSSYGVSRDRIHHRSTGYSLVLHLKLATRLQVPWYSSWGWDKGD